MPRLLCYFFVLSLLLFATAVFAIPLKPSAKHPRQTISTDSTKLELRHFNNAELQQYARDKNFKYNDTGDPGSSWLERLWNWMGYVISSILSKIRFNKASWFLFKAVFFTLAAAGLLFIIFKVLGIDIIKILRGESKNIDIPYTESLENIHDINFDTEIENAISNRNYRLAVRLLYLRSLKQLNDAQLIHWQIEKTNTAYLSELANAEHRQLFSLLTTQFEYIWYGDFAVDGQTFQNINALFVDFKKQLA